MVIESALACSELLLKLEGIKVSEGIILPSDQDMDSGLKVCIICFFTLSFPFA